MRFRILLTILMLLGALTATAQQLEDYPPKGDDETYIIVPPGSCADGLVEIGRWKKELSDDAGSDVFWSTNPRQFIQTCGVVVEKTFTARYRFAVRCVTADDHAARGPWIRSRSALNQPFPQTCPGVTPEPPILIPDPNAPEPEPEPEPEPTVGEILHLKLDEGTGTLASDTSGEGNDGLLVSGAAFTPNSPDGSPFSVHFDGVDDTIDIGIIDVLGDELTITAWIYPLSFGGDKRIISKATGTSSNDHIFMMSLTGVGGQTHLRGRIRVGGQTTTLVGTNHPGLVVNTWQHLSMVYDGTTMKLFVDGQEVGSTPFTGDLDIDPGMLVAIGSQPPGAGGAFFHGDIDEVIISQQAMSLAELQASIQ